MAVLEAADTTPHPQVVAGAKHAPGDGHRACQDRPVEQELVEAGGDDDGGSRIEVLERRSLEHVATLVAQTVADSRVRCQAPSPLEGALVQATLLDDGRVLISGGFGRDEWPWVRRFITAGQRAQRRWTDHAQGPMATMASRRTR